MTPKLRFPNFHSNWRKVLLSEIATKSKTKNTGFTESLVLTNSAKYGVIAQEDFFDRQIVTERNLESYSVVLEGSFVYNPRISVTAPCGPINRNDYRNGIMSPLYVIFDVDTNLSDYLRCYFRTTKWHIYAKAVSNYGVRFDRMNITTTDFFSMPIHIPSESNERNRIVEFIETINTKINLLTKKKEALETYKKGLMQKIFSQELRFKREDGTDYPEWEENEIGQIFKEIRDKVGDSVVETFSITAGKGFVSQAVKFGRDISGSQNPNYIRLKPNQYSYNKGNSKTFKYGCVYRNLIGKDIAVPNVFISLDLLNGDYRYFDTLFESHLLDRHLRKIISSSARMDGLLNIPKRDFFLISLPVPCLEEQAKIGQSMHQLDKSIGVIERQLQNVISLKKGLLQQMFV